MRLFILLVASFISAHSWSTSQAAEKPNGKPLKLTFFEMQDIGIGCGLAIAIQTPAGQTWLYDTGVSVDEQESFNAGRDVIAPYLKREGIERIDGIIISHPHNDHYGGLEWLLNNYKIDRLFDSGYAPAYQDSIDKFVEEGGDYHPILAGSPLVLDEQLQVDVLAPPAGFFKEANPEKRASYDHAWHYMANKNSITLRIRHGKVTILLPGDIQEQDQGEFMQEYYKPEDLKATIMSAPGHGLHADLKFAKSVQPEVVVISCLNRYGDGQRAKKVYGDIGSAVYSNKIHGQVQIVSDGQHYEVSTERTGK
ncbi:ComEC/Rec2 family competence protein [Adhaeretor mobilis]|uniref:ComEC family competence protein n=1 Tax=Adhaeretor mobilis TaxID=1930276 RepID=A0A517MZS0_9BACT|nr:MBL fold metallo-hydrolase [Adhaeretor mobilis]QDT00379.1 ComEC family competence protein [Adhaeretor mobilis]